MFYSANLRIHKRGWRDKQNLRWPIQHHFGVNKDYQAKYSVKKDQWLKYMMHQRTQIKVMAYLVL